MSEAASWELDHVFFATAERETVEARLGDFGLVLSAGQIHQGQGTANTCVTFENGFFEILFTHDHQELCSELVRPLGLKERIEWRETGACPFGICFRPNDISGDQGAWPFPVWSYEPPYVPAGAGIPIVTPRNSLSEPLLFLAFHAAGKVSVRRNACRSLTRVEIGRPEGAATPSTGVNWFVEHGLFALREGREYILHLKLDGGHEGKSQRIAPDLPIVVNW